MSFDAINWATKQRVGNATAKHALLWLAFHANGRSGECFPSVELLMEEMEVGSKNTVKAALKTLIDAGLISSKREMKGNRVSRTFYCLNVDGSISDPSNIDGSNIDRSNIDADRSITDPYGSNSDRLMGQPLTPNKEVNKEENKERNREVSMRTSGISSAIAAVASAQAQTLPTSFPQSSNSENSSKPENAGRLSLSNALERSINTHGGHLDTPDGQTHQRDARCSQNASTIVSGACLENETPPMSDEDLENLFANAQLEECPPFPEKGEHPPFEKGVRLPDVSEKGDHLSTATKHRATTRRKPSTPCPFDMESSIPDEYLGIAKKAGIGDPQRVFSSFVAHAVANGRRLIVWPAGFRNWCDNELKWHPDQKPKITPQSQKTAKDYEWI